MYQWIVPDILVLLGLLCWFTSRIRKGKGGSVAMGAVCKFDQCYFYENHAEKSKEFLVIEIVNTVGKSKEKNKRNGHQGLGLENVKEALKKYEGTCTIEQEDGEFRVILLIPDAREEEKA